jgi:hypothetical protein
MGIYERMEKRAKELMRGSDEEEDIEIEEDYEDDEPVEEDGE